MEERLRGMLESGYGARIAAGYCWPWSDPVPGGGLKADVQIQNWHRPWNNKRPTSHAGAPGTPFWASDDAGFDQVGSVYNKVLLTRGMRGVTLYSTDPETQALLVSLTDAA